MKKAQRQIRDEEIYFLNVKKVPPVAQRKLALIYKKTQTQISRIVQRMKEKERHAA
jgi:hypothetical protein